MTDNLIYEPDEDTFLLTDTLKKELGMFVANTGKTLENISFLEMGAGSGYIGFTIEDEGIKHLLLADNNPHAIHLMKKQSKETASKAMIIESDLFSQIPQQEFDIIVFNTPYLPNEETVHDPALHGGPLGNEVSIEFLKQSKQYLSDKGFILLLTSSLAHPEYIKDYAQKNGLLLFQVAKQNLFFETLIVYKLMKKIN